MRMASASSGGGEAQGSSAHSSRRGVSDERGGEECLVKRPRRGRGLKVLRKARLSWTWSIAALQQQTPWRLLTSVCYPNVVTRLSVAIPALTEHKASLPQAPLMFGFSEHVGRDLWGRSLDELFEAASYSKQYIIENHWRCPPRPAASCEDRSISCVHWVVQPTALAHHSVERLGRSVGGYAEFKCVYTFLVTLILTGGFVFISKI